MHKIISVGGKRMDAMETQDVFYVRYMDDWVVLAKKKWKVRHAVRCANSVLAQLKAEKLPFKTYVGKTTHG